MPVIGVHTQHQNRGVILEILSAHHLLHTGPSCATRAFDPAEEVTDWL